MSRSQSGDGPNPLEGLKTRELVVRVQGGDPAAREALFRRYRPRLEHLVHGHLPRSIRDVNDTQDIVQNSLVRALQHLDQYDYQHEGGFLAWLRTIARHVIVDQLRRTKQHPNRDSVLDQMTSHDPSPLQMAVGAEDMETYERALDELPEHHRQAVILRLEYEMTYPEIAAALHLPSPNATRMMVHRATQQVARRMRELGSEP